MTLSEWLPLFFICLLGAVSPGPSFLLIVKHAVEHSPLHGIVAALCHATGIALYALLTLIGLSAVLINSPAVFNAIVYAGAAFLAWLGFKALTAKANQLEILTQQNSPTSLFKPARDGFSIALLNPKSAIFFGALFSQFVNPDSLNFHTSAILLLTPWTIDALWFCLVSIVVQKFKAYLTSAHGNMRLNRIAGVLFIGLAIKAIWP